MRVITGTAKGRRLKEVPGDTTRPITDRTKEALFSILGTWIVDLRILDLFGGTGAVGIEALSRGAAHVTFVELASTARRIIRENLQSTKLTERAKLIGGDAFKILAGEHAHSYDIIYIAPPQYKEMWIQALKIADERPDLLTEDGIAIVQIHPKEFRDIELKNLTLYDKRKYGSTLLCFYEKPLEDKA